MTNHSAAPAAPHSADALKQTELLPCPCCGGKAQYSLEDEPEVWWVGCTACSLSTDTSDDQADAIAAWNRRPTPASDLCADLNAERINTTPASPGLDNEAAARLRKQAEEAKNVRGVVALSPEDAFALLGCLERAEARVVELDKATDIAIELMNEANSDAESAEAAAGAVPEGYVLVPDAANADEIVSRLYRRFKEWSQRGFGPDDVTWCEVKADVQAMIAAAPPAQGLPAAPLVAPEELSELLRMADSVSVDTLRKGMRLAIKALTEIANAPPAAAPSEPVAWMRPAAMEPEFTSDAVVAGYWMRKGSTVTPLAPFATPPAQDAGTGEAAHANAIEALSDLAEKAQANGNSDAWVSRKVLLVRSAFRSNQNEVSADIARTVRAHCNDLSDCAAILDEDGRFKNTATEIRVAVTELRRAIANSGRLE